MAPNPLNVDPVDGEKDGVKGPRTESLLVRVSAWVHKGEPSSCGAIHETGETPDIADVESEELASTPGTRANLTGRVAFAPVDRGQTFQQGCGQGLSCVGVGKAVPGLVEFLERAHCCSCRPNHQLQL